MGQHRRRCSAAPAGPIRLATWSEMSRVDLRTGSSLVCGRISTKFSNERRASAASHGAIRGVQSSSGSWPKQWDSIPRIDLKAPTTNRGSRRASRPLTARDLHHSRSERSWARPGRWFGSARLSSNSERQKAVPSERRLIIVLIEQTHSLRRHFSDSPFPPHEIPQDVALDCVLEFGRPRHTGPVARGIAHGTIRAAAQRNSARPVPVTVE